MIDHLAPFWNFDRSIGIGGTAIGLIGAAIAVYYGQRAEKIRQPTFSIKAGRFVLIPKIMLKFADFSIQHNGEALSDQDVSQARIRFWNSGRLPIVANEILTPFRTTFPPECKLLNTLIANVSRQEIHAKILREKVGESDSIVIDAALFEPNDGLTIQVIYSGPCDAEISFSGSCIGASSPLVLSVYEAKEPNVSPLKDQLTAIAYVVTPYSILMGLALYVGNYKGRGQPYLLWGFFIVMAAFTLLSVVILIRSVLRKKRVPTSLVR